MIAYREVFCQGSVCPKDNVSGSVHSSSPARESIEANSDGEGEGDINFDNATDSSSSSKIRQFVARKSFMNNSILTYL